MTYRYGRPVLPSTEMTSLSKHWNLKILHRIMDMKLNAKNRMNSGVKSTAF